MKATKIAGTIARLLITAFLIGPLIVVICTAFSAVMAVCFILSGTALIRKAGKH